MIRLRFLPPCPWRTCIGSATRCGSVQAYEVCGSPRPSGGARLWDSALHNWRHRRFVAIATGYSSSPRQPAVILSLLLWLGLQPRPGTREASPSASLPPPVPPSSKLGGTGGAPPTDRNLLRNQRTPPRARRRRRGRRTVPDPSMTRPDPNPPPTHPPDRTTACGSRSENDRVGAAYGLPTHPLLTRNAVGWRPTQYGRSSAD